MERADHDDLAEPIGVVDDVGLHDEPVSIDEPVQLLDARAGRIVGDERAAHLDPRRSRAAGRGLRSVSTSANVRDSPAGIHSDCGLSAPATAPPSSTSAPPSVT